MTQQNAIDAKGATSSSVTSASGQVTLTGIVPTESTTVFHHQVGVTVTKTIEICAAHFLPYHDGKCKRLHGHNYKIEVSMRGVIRSTSIVDPQSGMVEDFYNIGRHLQAVIGCFDHQNLNDYFANPTAEILAYRWLVELLKLDTRYLSVKVKETDDCWAIASR